MNAKDLGNYWFPTGTPTFLIEFLKEINYNIQELNRDIMVDDNGLSTYNIEEQNLMPLLFQTGYLTIKDYNTQADLYRLGYPNDEVYEAVNELIETNYMQFFV